ncbi:MAG: NADH dehydrogenase [Bacteriovoracaceae bacterium]|jgi:NADH dehydrogenase
MKKVIIIGGGFGGLSAAKTLGGSSFDVTLFDKSNHHLFQPLLYQVASAALSPADIAVPIREVVSKYKNIKVLMDGISKIDPAKNQIQTESGKSFDYDYLILAVGARHSYFANPEWEEHAPGLKTLGDALNIRNQLLKTFEEAEKSAKYGEEINLVVVGGGPTGVEMAGALAEITKETLVNDFRNIDSSKAVIYLVEGAPQILGMYPASLSLKAQKDLEKLGVRVLLKSFVKKITKNSVETTDQVIETKNIIWAAGNKASPLLTQLNSELDNAGRALVNPNLSTKAHKNIFVIGDAAHFKDDAGKPLPGLAPVATQQGRYLGKSLLSGSEKPFKYFDKGSMATIGKFKAVLQKGPIRISGLIAWLAWSFIHILFLIDFRNKLVVFTQWTFTFLFSKRGVRIINDRDNNGS